MSGNRKCGVTGRKTYIFRNASISSTHTTVRQASMYQGSFGWLMVILHIAGACQLIIMNLNTFVLFEWPWLGRKPFYRTPKDFLGGQTYLLMKLKMVHDCFFYCRGRERVSCRMGECPPWRLFFIPNLERRHLPWGGDQVHLDWRKYCLRTGDIEIENKNRWVRRSFNLNILPEAKDFLKQAGGYLAEPQSLEQMEFLTGVAGLEADLTGIRNWVVFWTSFCQFFVQKLVDWFGWFQPRGNLDLDPLRQGQQKILNITWFLADLRYFGNYLHFFIFFLSQLFVFLEYFLNPMTE